MKKVSLELGGKSPLIIFSDCELDKAVRQVSRVWQTTVYYQLKWSVCVCVCMCVCREHKQSSSTKERTALQLVSL